MFTKEEKVGEGRYEVTKTVLDWDTIWGWVFFIGIAIVILKSCN